jgi:RHS repeat-associated protein
VGSVIAMSNADGTLAEGPYTYDAYGNCYAGGQPCANGGRVPYRFTGRRLDPETGLYYYRARYYWSEGGRFLQTDPVGYKDDIDWYAYVGNDPTDRVDPTGLADENLFAHPPLTEGDAALSDAADQLQMGPAYFSVAGHGSPYYGILDERRVSFGQISPGQWGRVGSNIIGNATTMLRDMQNHGFQRGQTPFFISCELGANPMVRDLANKIGGPVYASRSMVEVSNGSVASKSWFRSTDSTITMSSKSGFVATMPDGSKGAPPPTIYSITINTDAHTVTYDYGKDKKRTVNY